MPPLPDGGSGEVGSGNGETRQNGNVEGAFEGIGDFVRSRIDVAIPVRAPRCGTEFAHQRHACRGLAEETMDAGPANPMIGGSRAECSSAHVADP